MAFHADGGAGGEPVLLGTSLLYRVEDVAELLRRGRRDFGDQLPLVLEAVRQALAAFARQRHAPAATRLLDQLEGAPHYRVRAGVIMPVEVEHKVGELAAAFFRKRGRRLLITSGTRTPLSQAEAMYTKLAVGGRTRGLYRKWREARDIELAYRRARSRRLPRQEVIAAMTRVIETQVGQGVHVSPHLQAGAVDLRSLDLPSRDRRALQRLARGYPWLKQIKLERRPPHFHLWIATAAGDAVAAAAGHGAPGL